MTTEQTMTHVQALAASLASLEALVYHRLHQLKGDRNGAAPQLWPEALGRVFLPHLRQTEFQMHEGLLLTLALFPHVRPELFDQAIQAVFPQGGSFPELGGLRGSQYRGFLPTGFTALSLLGGDDLEQRMNIQALLSPDHWLAQQQVLRLAPPERQAPPLSGQLLLDPELVERITQGRVSRPVFSSEFPAAYVETPLSWDDLVLPDSTQQQIEDILTWLSHDHTLRSDWAMGHRFKPGYRVLFHGAPGTGKTLTATLLGKHTDREVYKVDLSTVVSKYIGETEKNLSHLFDRAENKQWILFFDEADALFGKRTQVQNAHDRYANQEVSYLLQRIESFDGLVILASNFKSNIDDAFLRRFQAVVHFPLPRPNERLSLWQQNLPPQLTLSEDLNLRQIAHKFELTGADIVNVIHGLSLQAIAQQDLCLTQAQLVEGIRKELTKANKML